VLFELVDDAETVLSVMATTAILAFPGTPAPIIVPRRPRRAVLRGGQPQSGAHSRAFRKKPGSG